MNQNNNSKWKDSWDNPESDLVVNYDLIHDITILKRDEILSLFQNYAEFVPSKEKVFIDLGAGTGAAAFSILQKYPDAKAVLVDGSKPMLEQAQKEADAKGYNIETIYQDFTDLEWVKKSGLKPEYPLIISSIMIHHLTDKERARFFKDIYDLILPPGKFLYADVVKMSGDEEEQMATTLWIEEIIKNKKIHGLTPKSFEEEKEWILTETAKQGDMPATIPDILVDLDSAGFQRGTMLWFYVKFALFIGIKQD